MSGAATVVEQVRTLGPIPRTMPGGVFREKGVVRVEEVPVPRCGTAKCLLRWRPAASAARTSEDISALCGTAADPGP